MSAPAPDLPVRLPQAVKPLSFSIRLPLAVLLLGLHAFAGSAPGIKNFDRVDQQVYRGGQPAAEGFEYLAHLGVKNILDLRGPGNHSVLEERVVTAVGMHYIQVPMTGFVAPTEAEIAKILALLEDPASGPVFVHCWRGTDRTGAVIAAYHIHHDRWPNTRALKDANAHGMRFLQFPRKKFVKSFRPPPRPSACRGGGQEMTGTPPENQ